MSPGRPAPDDQPGRVRLTPPGVLAGCFAVALVGGWLVRPIAVRLTATAPVIGWLQVGVLWFVAAILVGVAFATWRQLQVRRTYLDPHRSVNRLVLAKACGLVGALVAGGYAGYALSWWGLPEELASQRIVRSLAAALAGAAIVAGSAWLERACRVHDAGHGP